MRYKRTVMDGARRGPVIAISKGWRHRVDIHFRAEGIERIVDELLP